MKYFHVTGTIDDPSLLGPLIEEEKVASQRLQDEGATIAAFRRADRPGVWLFLRAESSDDAMRQLGRLPFVAEGAMTVDVVEVLPA